MWKKRKIDFILSEEKNEYEEKRLLFRFYPRSSYCHSFDENLPTCWKEVYKVYYSWAIISQIRENENDNWESCVVYEEPCDECSVIDEISYICKKLYEGIEFEIKNDYRYEYVNKEIVPLGMATSWFIKKRVYKEWWKYPDIEEDEDMPDTIEYSFELWSYWDKGFRFSLKKDDLLKFSEYLDSCCDYMLKHGNPI